MYEQFYGLRGKPFQLTPDPQFFFDSRGHKRAMSYLKYGLLQGEGFIVVTGDVGAGKTTLIRNLLRTLANEKVVPANLVSTQVDADDVLRLVCAAYRLPHEGQTKATLLQSLERFFQMLYRENKRAVLFVDEAQNLTPRAVEELRMLSNFQVGDRWMMQTFLLGQPEFRAILQSPDLQQLRQRVIAQYHLGPLDEPETHQYIEHRLTRVGWKGDPKFEADAFAPIYQFTNGVPRRINTLCDRILLAGYLEERHTINKGHIEEVVAELNTELGTDLPAARADQSLAANGSAHGPRAPAGGEGVHGAGLNGDAGAGAHLPPLAPGDPESLHRLERTLASALEQVRSLIGEARPQ